MFNSAWYNSLIKPPFAPFDWVFAPAWIFLYFTIFLSFFIYLFSHNENKQQGYIYFAIQMILNLLWTSAFFGLKNMFLGLIIIGLMDIFLILTIQKFYKISKMAGIILVPYLIWILYATYLNAGYLILNSQ